MNTFTYLILALLAASVALQWWLAARHIAHVRRHRDQVPADFADQISLQAHQKAADYTVARVGLGRWDLLLGAALLLVWTIGGGLAAVDRLWQTSGLEPVLLGTAVLLSVLLISQLLDLPLAAYRTFRLEQGFGFNRSSWSIFFADTIKSMILLILLGGPLAAAVLWIMHAGGPWWWLYAWLVWFGFTLLVSWAYPAFIAPWFNRFTPLERGDLRQGIEALLQQCGFNSRGIFVMDGSRRSSHANAYFTGLGKNKRVVFYDTLVNQLDGEEIEAVLAHELGHFRLHHVRKGLLGMGALSLAGLALLAWLAQHPWFYGAFGLQASPHMALLLFLLLAPIAGFFLTPVFSLLSRKHEFEADAYAVHQRGAGPLIRALVKLYEENASTLTPDPLYSRIYDSHPPAPVRILHLKTAAARS